MSILFFTSFYFIKTCCAGFALFFFELKGFALFDATGGDNLQWPSRAGWLLLHWCRPWPWVSLSGETLGGAEQISDGWISRHSDAHHTL